MSTQRFQILLAAICMLANLLSVCYAQAPIASENFCKEEGLSDNLSCEKEDGSRECFARSELCNKRPFCKDGLDEGMSQIRLDCDGSLTGRKPDENGEIEPGFLCSNGTILDITQMCDGTADCDSGEDETNLLCANKCRGPYYGGCSHTRECESTPEGATCGNCLPGFARNPSDYTIGHCLVAVFGFQSSSYSVCEGRSRTVYIQLHTDGVLDQAVRVTVRTVDTGSATADEDYIEASTELLFSPFNGGGTRRFLAVRTRSDNTIEGSETFQVEASAGNWPLTRNTTTVTINECSTPPVQQQYLVIVGFSSAREDAGVITAYIHLNSGVDTLQEDVVVNVTTSDYRGSHRHYASENIDYTETSATLTFPMGTRGGARLPFNVSVIDDNIAEYYEDFIVTASVRGSGFGIYTRLSHNNRVRIFDNDPFIVTFEHTNYTVMEGEAVEVCVVNVTNPDKVHVYSVQLFTVNDCDNNTADATADLDYAGKYGRTQLTFSSESYRECFTIQTYYDEVNEPVEKFLVQVGRRNGLGRFQSPLTIEVFISNVQVIPVTVSIENPSYTISPLDSSVEVCATAENTLDQPVNISLQSSYEVKYVTLTSESLRSCAVFSFPEFLLTNNQADNIRATVVSGNGRVDLGRSISEVIPQIDEAKEQCPQLANPLNGQVDESLSEGQIQQGSIATYTCNIGFVPDVQRFRECLSDFTWSGSPVQCEPDSFGELTSSTNEIILGFLSTSPFLVVTTNVPQSVFYTISRNTGSQFDSVSSNTYDFHSTSQNSKVHVKAEEDREISVFGWEQTYSQRYTHDAFLAFSTASSKEVDDYEYYSLPFSNPSSLFIVASEDDTRINLPSSSLMLDRFQTHRIDNIHSSSSLRVTSNRPVAVTSAKSCLDRARNCDFLVEQVLPTHLWGRAFLVASFSGLKTGESIRIIFSKLSTSVTVTCAESNFFHSTIGRGPGQWVDVELDEGGRDRFCIIEATDPVYVVQYARESDGESYMMTIPSIDHYGGSLQGFYTLASNNPFNFVTLYVTPEYYEPRVDGILVDGVPAVSWKEVQCSNGSICGYIARPVLRRGNYHTIVHTNPRARLGVSAYGYDVHRNISFGFPVSLQIPPDQNIDECLPQLDLCGSNAECKMSNGRYVCVCDPGYQSVGQKMCIDVDECEQSSSSCDVNARCTNTVGSFTCTCNPGFTGTGRQCTPESSLIQFKNFIPFIDLDLGKETAGSFDELADDECRLVRLDSRVPVGGSKISEISICDNGIISLGDRPFKIWRPQLFPSDNPLISRSNVLAVFWNDHQPASSSSKVSYQIFEKGGFDEVKNVNLYMSEQLGGKFEGNWMIAISWDDVTPLLQQQSGRISTNSYQAVITTDFRDTYVIFTYDNNRLEWIGTGAQRNVYSVVGYNLDQRAAGSLDNIPSFQNHRLSGTSDVEGISKFNFRARVQWSNVIYHIGREVALQSEQSFADCKLIESQDINLFINLGVRLERDLACPCSINQAVRDRRYIYASGHLAAITGDVNFNSRNCFVQIFRPFNSNRGVHMCCYSSSEETFGALLDTTFGAEASSFLRFHPYSEHNQYLDLDYRFYESCCLNPRGECNIYTDQRKADDCGSYTPSSFAWAWGDPHISTLDGMMYTFNGWGEYTLMEINTPGAHFLLQGRTHPVSDSNATQFIGFAFGSSANDTVEVQLSEDNSNFVVLLRGSDITSNVSNTDNIFFSPNQDVFITRDSQSSLTCSFPVGISVTVSLSSEMLSFVVEIPDQFQNVTQGLMGNNNGIRTDDIVYRNGTMLAYDASDRQIHEFGQSWQITPKESLFTYPEGTSAEDYAHPDHVPEFLDEVVSTATVEVLSACGDSVQCIYDASQTGDLNIGLETMVTNEANVVYRQEAINMPPVIVGPPTLLVTLGQEAEFVFTVTDDNNLFNVSVVGGLPVNSTLTSTPQDGFTSYTFTWTIFEIVDVSLMFEARDERSAVSVLSVQVQICACQNGGECTLNGLLSSSDRTVVLNCNCPEAYGGRFCAEDYDGCSDIICFTEVACVDQPAPGVGAMCGPCPDGYFGDGEKCIDIDECEDDNHDCSDICVNNDGGFECDCSPGYTLINSTDCADVDECAVLNGDCHQVCNNFDGGFSCSCNEGFELTSDNRTCQVLPESSCGQETICTQNCVRLSGVEVCSCDPGYQLADDGANCLDIDECMESPCDQMCTNQEGGFQCSCRAGYELEMDGRTCQDIDECSLAAQNNTDLCTPPMICSNTDGGFECLCPAGTEAAGGTCIPIGINVRRVNDSVIGDPLMTVPLYLTNTSALDHVELSEDEVVNLCFEIHGRADEYFNLVSDSCVSVNAHYVRAHPLLGYNIINEITVRAVGLDGTCRNIAVRVSGCQAFIDGTVLNGTFSSAGVSVRTYSNRVRISLPNCQDLDLVMWVFCERNELRGFPEQGEPDINVGVDLLRFVIARGYNIRETAHGLLGQFWNIPIDIERYTGALSDGSTRDDTYILTVNYPDSPPRRFPTFLHSPTWDRRGREYCLYGGNRQGGGIQELRSPNDPIIEGKYREYIVSGPFDVDFVYAHFESSECN